MDLTITPDQWLQRAATATDSLDFDVCVSRGLPFFADSIDRVETARGGLFGEWEPERAGAYLAGLKKYTLLRGSLEASGQPTLSAHKQAKEAALSVYHLALEREAA